MKLTNTLFRQWFGDMLFPIGFSFYNRVFYRETQDVVQVFTARSDRGIMGVYFGLIPKCGMLYPLDTYCGSFDITNLLFMRKKRLVWDMRAYSLRFYDLSREFVSSTIIPIFERATTAPICCEEIWNYREMEYKENRYMPPYTEESMLKWASNICSIMMYLQDKNYDMAMQMLPFVVWSGIDDYHTKTYEKMKSEGAPEENLEHYKKFFVDEAVFLAEVRRRAEVRDHEFLEQLFAENRLKWQEYLKKLPKTRIRPDDLISHKIIF